METFYLSQMNPKKILHNNTFSVQHHTLPVTPFKIKNRAYIIDLKWLIRDFQKLIDKKRPETCDMLGIRIF